MGKCSVSTNSMKTKISCLQFYSKIMSNKWLIQMKHFYVERTPYLASITGMFLHVDCLHLFIADSLRHFKIPSQRYISQVIILFAEGSNVADIAMLH